MSDIELEVDEKDVERAAKMVEEAVVRHIENHSAMPKRIAVAPAGFAAIAMGCLGGYEQDCHIVIIKGLPAEFIVTIT
jgi:hypothetical protein